MILPSPGMDRRITHVALLVSLLRLVLIGRDKLGAEFIQLAMRCFQLLINQPDADT